ncbi:MAG: 5-dehydro-2-deoxygluconokinase [Ilumatobacter sp.]|nr:5-dehydro-2-deoxygluconokinase [Ilumatobacter sp.]MDG2040017.1 5-dehydro-2-deoxygluconokinase [Ilumatobacter sp.]
MTAPFRPEELEVLTLGRSSVDLYPEQHGVALADVATFRKSIGGSPTNVAVAAARLGRKAAVINRVGDDAFGNYIRQGLREFGVSDDYIITDTNLLTPVVFCELLPPEEPSIYFYREPRGPDMNINVADIPADAVRAVPLFWTAGSRFAEEPSRTAAMEALRLRDRGAHTVIDLDYRPMFWDSAAQAAEFISPVIDLCTVAVGNRDECEIAVGTRVPDEAADRMLERGVTIAIVKLGGDGVLVATEHERVVIEPIRVPVVCGLGAGDAFGGSLCHGLLAGWDPAEIVARANAAGAIVAGRLMCSDEMPTPAEIDHVLKTGQVPERVG